MNDRTLPDPDAEPTISVARAAAVLGVSKPTIYEAIKRGECPSVPIGARRIIPTRRFLAAYQLDAA